MKPLIRSHTWLIAAALAAFVTLTAACGASDDDASAPPGGGFSPGRGSDAPSGVTNDGNDGAQSGGATQHAQIRQKLIRTATIEISTASVQEKFEDISDIALSAGGVVFSSQFGDDGERQTASITIRVPGDRYEDVLVQLRGLGDVRKENSNATDVTEEFTDLTSNLTNLQATEREYLELLSGAQNVDEILTMQDRINGTRAQIEQVQGRLNLIGSQTEYATITAHLTQAAVAVDESGRPSLGEVAAEAFDAGVGVLFAIALIAIAVGAFGWWLLPLAALVIYLGRRQIKLDRARHEAPPPAGTP